MFTKWDHLGRSPQVEMTGKGARCGFKVEFLNWVWVRIRGCIWMVEYWLLFFAWVSIYAQLRGCVFVCLNFFCDRHQKEVD